MRKIAIIMVLALTLTIGLVHALGDPGGSTISNLADEGSYLDESNDTVDINGSQIYTLNLDSDVSTVRWAGITGNLSGSIVLGDENEDTLYTWSGEGLVVYAAESLVDWSALVDASSADVVAVYTHITDAEAPNDAYLDTFTNTVAVDIGSNIFSITSDWAGTYNNNTAANDWQTFSLKQVPGVPTAQGEVVFAGLAQAGQNDYKGSSAEYQMILPEDETSDDDGIASTFYLWVELE